jgi:uncharacterized membrane protein
MSRRILNLVRDAILVFLGTVLAGALVAFSLGDAQRNTPLWRLSLTLTIGVVCIGVFFVAAHLASGNRFIHVWLVALISSLPNLYYFATGNEQALSSFLTMLAMMLIYSSIGGGLFYAFRRSNRSTDESVV